MRTLNIVKVEQCTQSSDNRVKRLYVTKKIVINKVSTRKAEYYFEPRSRYVSKDSHQPVSPTTLYRGYGCRASKCPYRHMTCNKCKLKIR